MGKLDELEVAILRGVESGGVREVPAESEDGGHTAWLLREGYIEEGDDRLFVTRKGRAALLGREEQYVDLDEIEYATLRLVSAGQETRVPDESEDLGYTRTLIERGFITHEGGRLVLSLEGRRLLDFDV